MKNYIIKVLDGMALGLFSSLVVGLILKQIGSLTGLDFLVTIGDISQRLMSPAIGAGVAYAIKAPALVFVSSMIAGALGGGAISPEAGQFSLSFGEPVGAFIASLVAADLGSRLSGKTKIDIILLPAVTIVSGGLVAYFISQYISSFMNRLGDFINFAANQYPFIMGILISFTMGLALTMPISSAAIGISLNLSGLAAGAAVVGGSCHMIGFAVASYKDNGFGGFISQALGTSMIQISNIVKKPFILLPAILSSIILGPLSTLVFKMEADPIGSGMGTSGLVGQISTYNTMGPDSLIPIAIMHFLLPALISYIVTKLMYKKSIIRPGDMKLNTNK